MARNIQKGVVVDTTESSIDTAAISDNQNALANIEAAFSDQEREITFLIGERTGKRKLATMIQKLLTVTDLIDLQNIKESKVYKGFRHIGADGKPLTIQTFQEYCTVVEGRSYDAINLELNNLRDLGPQLFDAMRQVGIGPGTMREIRQLPDDQKALLEQAKSLDDKNDIVELIDALTTKHAKEKEDHAKKVEDITGQNKAKDQLLKERGEENAKLRIDLEKANRRIKTATPDDEGFELSLEARGITNSILGQIRCEFTSAIEALQEFEQRTGINQHAMKSALAIELWRALNDVIETHGLDLTIDTDTRPLWDRDDTDGSAD